MAQYHYRARNKEGKEVKGSLRAPNENRATALLRANDLAPLEIKSGEQKSILNINIGRSKIDTKDLVLFNRELSSMIRAGVPIIQAIKALVKQISNKTFQGLLKDIQYDIEGGESLSNALSKYPKTFSLFYLGVIRTGEASGTLSKSLDIMADYLNQNYTFTKKVRSALMYPLFVLATVLIISVIMVTFVMPQILTLFEDSSVPLPLPTRILMALTNFSSNYWYVVVLIVIALAVIIRSYLKTSEGQYTISSWLLRIPVINQLFRKIYLARLTSILHTLFDSNVPIVDSLTIAQESIGNKVYQRILKETTDAVKNGAAISSVWEIEHYIPPMLSTMVAVGEKSGNMDTAFKEANSFFSQDVEEMLGTITVFIEPVMVIILGIGVGFVVAAVLLPIYNLVLVL